MSRNIRAIVLSLLTALLAALCTSALAADLHMSFTWDAGSEPVTVALTQNTRKEYVLFLPGVCDPSAMTLTVHDREGICWNGTPVQSGEALDVSGDIGSTVQVTTLDGVRLNQVKILQGSVIPSVFVTITDSDVTHIHKSKKYDIRSPGKLVMLDRSGIPEAVQTVDSFHMRGNSTRYGMKKPYQLKLAKKESLGGMPKAKTWLLLANWFDISLIRNQITLDLCRELGLKGTPRGIQADLYLNGEYQGVYYLCEKIQLSKDRLDITDMEDIRAEAGQVPEGTPKLKTSKDNGVPLLRWHGNVAPPQDTTGGFLLELEKPLQFSQNKESGGFKTNGEMFVIIKEPTLVDEASSTYIANLVNDFHNAAIADDGINPKTGLSYMTYIDADSFALKIIVEEISGNFDVKAASQFLYKDSDRVDSRLHAGPGWDYDLTYGNKADKSLLNPLQLNYVYTRSSANSNLYRCLLRHDDFAALTRRLYLEKALPALEILLGRRPAPEGSCLRPLTEYADDIRASADMNFCRWNANLIKDLYNRSGRTFDEANAYLLDWLTRRTDALTEGWLVE